LILRAMRAVELPSVAGMELQAIDSNPAMRPPVGVIVRTDSAKYVRTIRLEDRMALTASKLRANVYRLLDEVLETGKPLEIERNGKLLVIAAKETESIWDRLPRREGFIVGDPDELIHIDWSSEWNPDPN
jgi:hypothetical protein